MDITLALGGGGAKGNSHIGVIRRLEQEGYKIRAIAGTSFGGLVAVLFASGMTTDQIEQIFTQTDQSQLYGRDGHDGPSLLGLAGVRKFLDTHLGEKTFKDLKLPCAVTAVDIKTGREIILSEGSLRESVLATIAIPGIFSPFHLNDWELVDGAVLNPVPVSVARMLSPRLPVVAVSLCDPLDIPLRPYTIPLPSILPRKITDRLSNTRFAHSYDVFMRSIDLNYRAVAHYRLMVDAPDVLICPEVHHIDTLEKVVVADVVSLGDQAVQVQLPLLRQATSLTSRLKRNWFGRHN